MEEIRSTDVLDREIVSDAKKKADKILSRAEETCRELLGGVGKRLEESRIQAQKSADSRLELYKKNEGASLPLEKERYEVSFVHGEVLEAINSYFEKAGEEKRLSVVQKLLERALPSLGKGAVHATVISFSKDPAEKMLRSILGERLETVETSPEALFADDFVPGLRYHGGVILSVESEHGEIVCRLTLDEKILEILDEYNFELAHALFGGRISE